MRTEIIHEGGKCRTVIDGKVLFSDGIYLSLTQVTRFGRAQFQRSKDQGYPPPPDTVGVEFFLGNARYPNVNVLVDDTTQQRELIEAVTKHLNA